MAVHFHYNPTNGQAAGTLAPDARGGVRFGVAPTKSVEEFVKEAAEVAKGVDAVILLVGLNAGV